ncbi:hypothetical protein H1S01_03425 [Heliobacterium chlorum]|uniref:Uncharacterized protein n=1 Tax=Heliobacterium chlorum TaxID=2698 RepID=A0ABR7T0Q5_HELCL|nr:hypothetical protein [Heliobacterium chlorum]MBC9783563.1 hypothetical protein [Heliobacterium chlorum]
MFKVTVLGKIGNNKIVLTQFGPRDYTVTSEHLGTIDWNRNFKSKKAVKQFIGELKDLDKE